MRAGCVWDSKRRFRQIKGSERNGRLRGFGRQINPTYKNVLHARPDMLRFRSEFDPSNHYNQLLDGFLGEPQSDDLESRQGPDVGTQYVQ